MGQTGEQISGVMAMNIYQFDDEERFPLSNRDGIYGGNGGNKDGILIDGEYWFIKYPKSTRGMRANAKELSYTTSPLSEFIPQSVKLISSDTNKSKTIQGVEAF